MPWGQDEVLPGGAAGVITALGIAVPSILAAVGILVSRLRKGPTRTFTRLQRDHSACLQRVAALEATVDAQQKQIDSLERQVMELIAGRGGRRRAPS